jgi:hypothetical protein
MNNGELAKLENNSGLTEDCNFEEYQGIIIVNIEGYRDAFVKQMNILWTQNEFEQIRVFITSKIPNVTLFLTVVFF